jgi:hypothetical protein
MHSAVFENHMAMARHFNSHHKNTSHGSFYNNSFKSFSTKIENKEVNQGTVNFKTQPESKQTLEQLDEEPLIDAAKGGEDMKKLKHESDSHKVDTQKEYTKSKDQSASSFFKPYRIVYIIIGGFFYALIQNDMRMFKEYEQIIQDLKETQPRASAVLVDKRESRENPTYLVRMHQNQNTNIDELLQRFEAHIKKIASNLTSPLIKPLVYG